MKNFLLTFLLAAIVLFVAVESRRGFKRGGEKRKKTADRGRPWLKRRCVKERPTNCAEFVDGTCVSCDDGFALKEFNFQRCNKKICVRLVHECPKNCSSCENGVCKECEPGFFSVQTRLIQRTICVPCGLRMKRAWPDVYFKECAEKGCGKGCANCSDPGLCTQCDQGLKLITPPNSNITKCVRKCPPFYKLDQDSPTPRCQLKKCGKFCQSCTAERICLKCLELMRRIKLNRHITCKKQCPPAFRGRLDPDSQVTICERRRKGGKIPTISDVL